MIFFARILKGAPEGNQNARGHHDGSGTKSPNERRTKSMSGKDAIKAMKHAGWEVGRVSGSHHIMKKPGCPPVPVPMHGKDLGIGLLKKIEKESGMKF
jgi:predicted RNA binding protein YcfA (HicA-like mRNA interferase family)